MCLVSNKRNHRMRPFEAGLSHSGYLWNSSKVLHVPIVCYFLHWIAFHCIDCTADCFLFIHSATEGHLACPQLVAITNKAALNNRTGFYVNLISISVVQIPKSGTPESYGKYVFSCVRICQTVFQDGCTVVHCHSKTWKAQRLRSLAST